MVGLDVLVGLLALIGACFVLLGSIGLVRFPDYLLRLHAASKTPTLGAGTVLLASSLHFSVLTGSFSLLELLAVVLLFASVPVSALMLIRAALHLDPRLAPAAPEETPRGGNSEQPKPPIDPESASHEGPR